MIRFILPPFLILASLPSLADDQSKPSLNFGERLELDELVDAALYFNQELSAAVKMVDAAWADADSVGFWSDPRLTLSLSNLPGDFSLHRSPMSGIQISLMQAIPFPGKNYYRRKIGDYKAVIAEEDYQKIRNTIVKEVRESWWNLFLIERQIEIVKAHMTYLETYKEIAETRYAAGVGTIQDAIRAQVELSIKYDELTTLSQRREVAVGKINILLGREVEMPLPPLGEIELWELVYSLDELLSASYSANPEIGSSMYQLESAKSQKSLSKLEFLPDITLGLGYRIREEVPMDPVAGENFWTFSLVFNIPVFSPFSQKHKLDSASAKLEMSKAKLENVKDEVALKVLDLYLQIEDYREKIALYQEGILPLVEQSLTSAVAGYTTGSIDFLTLLNNEALLLEREMMYYQILADYHKKIAELESLVGTEIIFSE